MVQKNLHSCANENMGKNPIAATARTEEYPTWGKPDAQRKAIITVNMTPNYSAAARMREKDKLYCPRFFLPWTDAMT